MDKLSKTEDGFPLVDCDEIYAIVGRQIRRGVYSDLGEYECGEGYDGRPCINTKDGTFIATLNQNPSMLFGGCSGPFHTRAAAEAARAKHTDGE